MTSGGMGTYLEIFGSVELAKKKGFSSIKYELNFFGKKKLRKALFNFP